MNIKTTKLLSDLNEQLNFIELEIDNQITRCESSIEIILKVLINLKNLISKFKFKSETEEIQFFKEIKPQFSSKLIYNNMIYKIEMKRPNGGNRILKKYYNNELGKLKAFFDNELEFYKYYRSGSTYLDYKYFLRGKFDIKMSLDNHYFESDTKFSTSHDFKVAKILANDLIQLYLENQLIMIDNKDSTEKSQRKPNIKMMWTGSKVALTELIFALHTEGAFNNGAADLKDIAEYFEHIFEIDLGQYRRTFLEIKARKNDRTKFITTLNEKLSLEEIGRIFYHLIQRRGFLSNSRKGGSDDGAIFKGNPKEGKIGITETQESIQDKTLGSYLFEIYPKENQPFQDGLERIRNRYTTRKMYVDEFELIWNKQAQFHSNLNKDLKTLFGGRKLDGYNEDGILFYQRPLRSQKHLVGNCSFEPTKTKCPISAIPFEQFRVWQWVNTVEYNGKKISQEEKQKIVEFLYDNEKPEFKKIRKVIGKESAEFKFNYKDDDKIVGTHTISNLSNKKYFGKKWFEFSDKEQEDIWHVLYFFDSKSNLKEYAIKNWNFTEEQATSIAKFNVKDGYSSLSRKAISNILPYLKSGFTYDVAVVLGGIKNVFGSDWEKLSDEKRNFLTDNVYDIVRSKTKGGFIDIIKDILRNDYNVSDNQLRKLYHHSATIDFTELLEKLPVGKEADKEIQAIRNPIVITALFELRKLVNELIDEHSKIDEIKVEMARDLKISKTQRNKIRREQKRLERENDRVKARLLEEGQRITHDNILLYKLWEECKRTCPYTGKPISVTQLFSGEVQIEHIHPWSRSLNDSFSNKTLCYADENRKKGDKTPFEFYGTDEANWSAIKERALKLFSDTKEYPSAYQKFKSFVQIKFDDDFSSRQLNDTRYISKEAKNYLSRICKNVIVSPGQATSNLRQKWGMNNILNDENEKTREDHRHHAVDALVMACTKISYVQELSKWNRYNRNSELKNFPLPWESFRYDAEKAVEKILISHKKVSNDITVQFKTVEKNGKKFINKGVAARGQLHKETVYGKRNFNGEEAFHVRKAIDSLTTEKQLDKVVDESIKLLIRKKIQELGGFVKGNIPANTFFIVDENGIKQPQIFLPNKNGAPVPILKVRIKENIGGAEKLKENVNQWVNPRNNHHVLIYKDEKGNLKEEVVTFWTVVERKRTGQSTYQLPIDGKEIVTTLHINDMFLLGLNEEEINWENPDYEVLKEHLFKVQTLSQMFYEFRLSPDATQNKDTNSTVFKRIQSFGDGKTGWRNHNPIKVKISVSGKIQKL